MRNYPEDHIYQCEKRARYDARIPVNADVYKGIPREDKHLFVVRGASPLLLSTKGKGVKGQAQKKDAQTIIAESMSEAELQDNIIALAKLLGWLVHAQRPARTKDGRWMTPIQGDAGFPDLVLARRRDGRRQIIYAELKSETGKATPEQQEWLDLLGGCLWRPSDYETVESLLR